jgi:transcriptional regulator with XRE-family HTH domain
MTNEQIGLRIKVARIEKGMTLLDVSKKIGVDKSTIQRYEAGTIAKIKLPIISSISDVLGVNPAWIIGKSERKENSNVNVDELNNESRELLQFYNERSDLKIFYDKTKHLTPEDVNYLIGVVDGMKR